MVKPCHVFVHRSEITVEQALGVTCKQGYFKIITEMVNSTKQSVGDISARHLHDSFSHGSSKHIWRAGSLHYRYQSRVSTIFPRLYLPKHPR
jgi:hypothetical protein